MQLEKGPFERRTADFLWMMIFGAFALLVSEIIYISFHLMIIYVYFFLQKAESLILKYLFTRLMFITLRKKKATHFFVR